MVEFKKNFFFFAKVLRSTNFNEAKYIISESFFNLWTSALVINAQQQQQKPHLLMWIKNL